MSTEDPAEPGTPGHADTILAKDIPTQPMPPPRRSSPTMPPPPVEERYQIGPELGRGGMGRVVEATDVHLGRKVALKEVLPKAGNASARRFAREVALTARLEHPSIVPLYDAGTMPDGRPYYVMRRVSGHPLDELIVRKRTLDERIVLLPALQSAIDAVAHAHNRGVIHRDLKPANIIVGELGETVVIDWGLAKVIGEEDEPASRDSLPSDSLQTQMGSVFGTPGFMAPEQARGEDLGPQGDVYALGATLYQLLAGTPPHAGKSATEVLDKTLRHHMVPLAKIAPGTPPELVTIVNKALAHEPSQRYPHAGALGEDLRRFLAGQLVAAHRYTPGERFMRFARRHRATLAVAAIAMVALAALAWLSVARIMQERDAANQARRQALAEKAVAEKAHRELAIRVDALIVSRARGRLDMNPTEALATLKGLSPTSTQLDEARAVAQAAVMRGVTWAMQSTHAFTSIAQLSRDAKQLLQVSRDGMVRVWDLERRRLLIQRPFAALTRAVWITDGRLLVTHHTSGAVILEPKTNTVETIAMDPVDIAFPSVAGDKVVFTGSQGVGVLDVATRSVKKLATVQSQDVTLSPDAKLFAWTEANATIVVDDTGKELLRIPFRASRVELSAFRTVAVLAENKLQEFDLATGKAVAIAQSDGRDDVIVDIRYTGRELVAVAGVARLWAWNGKTTYTRGKIDTLAGGVLAADRDFIVALSTDNKIHFIGVQMQASVQLPANVRNARLVAGPHTSKVLVMAEGMIFGLDIDALRPRIIESTPDARAELVDDDTLLVMAMKGWYWLDIASGKRTAIDYNNLGPQVVTSVEGGRAIVSEHSAKGQKVMLVEKGSTQARLVVEGHGAWARLVPGKAIIFSNGDSRVMARIDGGEARELVKMNGMADGAVALGPQEIALHSSSGELVRASLLSGKIERTNVALGTRFFMVADAAGRVILAEDTRVLMWDGVVTQLATFDKTIAGLAPMDGAIAVVLHDHETYLVEPKAGATPRRVFPAGRQPPAIADDGKLMVTLGNADQLEIVELPSRAQWSVPPFFRGARGVQVSPTKRRVLQQSFDKLLVWTLPYAPSIDFGAWLDEHTNATVDGNGTLTWPWQVPNVKP